MTCEVWVGDGAGGAGAHAAPADRTPPRASQACPATLVAAARGCGAMHFSLCRRASRGRAPNPRSAWQCPRWGGARGACSAPLLLPAAAHAPRLSCCTSCLQGCGTADGKPCCPPPSDVGGGDFRCTAGLTCSGVGIDTSYESFLELQSEPDRADAGQPLRDGHSADAADPSCRRQHNSAGVQLRHVLGGALTFMSCGRTPGEGAQGGLLTELLHRKAAARQAEVQCPLPCSCVCVCGW